MFSAQTKLSDVKHFINSHFDGESHYAENRNVEWLETPLTTKTKNLESLPPHHSITPPHNA